MLMNEKAIAAERDKRVQQVLSENRSWTRYKGLMEALDGNNTARANIAKTALLVMENQAKYMANVARDKRMEAVFTNALGTLVPKIIDLVRIFYPNLIAHKLVDIQPLDRQNGQIVLVRPVFDSSAGGVTAGQQVFQHVTDGTYASENSTAVVGTSNGSSTTISGSVSPVPMRPSTVRVTCGTVVGTDNGAGVISGTGVTGTVDYSSGAISVTYTVQPVASASVVAQFRYDSEQNTSQIRSLDIQITNLPIQAEPHPMKVTWSQQSQFAAESHYDLDMGDMLTNLVD